MKIPFLVLLAALSAFADNVKLDVKREILPNGLTVLIHRNPQAPVVACRLFYKTGSVHEHPGYTGLAHLLEHMLFKGTQKVGVKDSVADAKLRFSLDSIEALQHKALQAKDTLGAKRLAASYDSVLTIERAGFNKDELWQTYEREGGTDVNAFTTDLMTAYYVTLPRNKVELFLWLEADRMQNAVLREFLSERDVVREERRMRYDDSPTGRYFETLSAAFYENHPYRNPTIGWPDDIPRLTRPMAEEHYRKYYKPNNAILVLAGDINADSALTLVRKYFGPIPRGEEFPPVEATDTKQVAAKQILQRRPDAKPRFDLLFQTPAIGHPDLYALDIAEGVLSDRSGRLYKNLVESKKLANSVDAANRPNLYISSFELEAEMRAGVSPDSVEAAIWAELERLKNEPVSERELQKVRNQVYASAVRQLSSMENVASQLAFAEMYGDWRIIATWPDHIAQVTAQDVQRVAQTYFRPERSTTGFLLPPQSNAATPSAAKGK